MKAKPLSIADRNDLAKLEERIQANLTGFIAAGEALAEINDRKLYRATHASFAAYCRARWNLSKSSVARLVVQAVVAGNVQTGQEQSKDGDKTSRARDGSCPDPCPISGRAAAVLAALPADVQKAIWAQASEGGKQPQTEELKQLVEQWRDQEVIEIQEHEKRCHEKRRRAKREKPSRGALSRMEELMARLEKLARQLDLADDAEAHCAFADRLERLADRLRGQERVEAA